MSTMLKMKMSNIYFYPCTYVIRMHFKVPLKILFYKKLIGMTYMSTINNLHTFRIKSVFIFLLGIIFYTNIIV